MQLISGRLALAQHAFRPAVLHTARRALQASPVMARQGERDEDKAARKAAKKAVKSAVQAKRRGEIPGQGSKKCDRCAQSKDLLIRCQVDETRAWFMVCGACWKDVSGGVTDGDAAHPHYKCAF